MDKRVSPVYRNKLEFVVEQLPEHGHVLDVGCGAGLYFHAYTGKGLSYVGVEPDAAVAAEGSVIAEAEALPFDPSSFDVVVSADVLEHVESPDRALDEIHRVLRIGGRLLLTVPNADFPLSYDPVNWMLNRVGLKVPLGIWAWGHRRLYRREEMQALLEAHGFRVLRYESRSHFLVGLSLNYLPYLTAYLVAPLMRRLRPSQQSAFRVQDGIERSKIYRYFDGINSLDKRLFARGSAINHCFVAERCA